MPPIALAAAAPILIGGLTGASLGMIALNVGLALAGSILQSALAGKPKGANQEQDRSATVRSAQAPRQIIYGQAMVRDPVLIHYETTDDDEKLHLILAFAGHEIEEFSEIYFEDEVVGKRDDEGNVIDGTFEDRARVIEHLGHPNQVADQFAKTELTDWESSDRGRGIAYLYVTLTGDTNVFPSIPKVSALIKGKNDIEHFGNVNRAEWTNNALLCAIDYLKNPVYGFGCDPQLISEIQTRADERVADEFVGIKPEWRTATVDRVANGFDLNAPGFRNGDKVTFHGDDLPAPVVEGVEYYWIKTGAKTGQISETLIKSRNRTRISLKSDGEDGFSIRRVAQLRYTCDGSFLTDRAPLDVLEDLVSAQAAQPTLNAAGYAVRPGTDRAAVGHLTVDMLRGDITWENRRPLQELYNAVGGTFTDANSRWAATDFPPVVSPTFQALDGGAFLRRDLTMPFVDESQRAQRLALIDLAQSRQMIKVEWPGNRSCIRYERGDLVEVTVEQAGWDRKKFFVARDRFSDDGGGYDLTLAEAADDLFDITLAQLEARDPAPDSNLRAPGLVAAPAGVTFTVRPVNTAGRDTLYMVDVFGELSTDKSATRYQAQLFSAGDLDREQPFDTGLDTIDPNTETGFLISLGPIPPTAEYMVRLRVLTWRQQRSAWVESDDFIAAEEIGGTNGGGDSPGSGGDLPSGPSGLANRKEVIGIVGSFGHAGAVTFTGGGGTGARGKVTADDSEETSFTFALLSGGHSYSSAPTASVTLPGQDDEDDLVISKATTIGNPTRAHLVWTDPADVDLARVDIYRANVSSFASAIKVSESKPGQERNSPKHTGGAATTRYYWLKAVDKSGNESAEVGPVAVVKDS